YPPHRQRLAAATAADLAGAARRQPRLLSGYALGEPGGRERDAETGRGGGRHAHRADVDAERQADQLLLPGQTVHASGGLSRSPGGRSARRYGRGSRPEGGGTADASFWPGSQSLRALAGPTRRKRVGSSWRASWAVALSASPRFQARRQGCERS